jgi:8-oxo-dGTP pyrophosphatase MutT (NUDIX family)
MKKNRPKKEHRAQTFRAGVGAVILNEDGKVLGLERKDIPGAWQLPQGGLDENETPVEAVKREIREETGIETRDLELLASMPRWLAYELPEEARSKKIGRGQVQRWFLFRFRGSDEAITLGDQKEFKAWKWIAMDELISIVVSFKQPVYQELAEYFKWYFENLA